MKRICFLLILTSSYSFFTSCGQRKKEFKCDTISSEIRTDHLQVFTGGDGENTVIFESGLGVDGSTWLESGIFDSIGKNNQVIAYDRLGYGKSSSANGPRGLQALVDDLDSVVKKFAENEKVILVGHSLGGAIVRAFASQHPDKVKAILFIEPVSENFGDYATMSQGHEDTLVDLFKDEQQYGAAMEAAQLIENISFLKQLAPLPDVPVVVITSTKTDEEMTPEKIERWNAAHESLRTGLTSFTHIQTNKSGHFVYLEEPDLIIENITKLTQ